MTATGSTGITSADTADRRPAAGPARLIRVLLATVVGIELLWIVFVFVQQWLTNPAFGLDYRWHVDAAQRLLDTGTPYWPWQIAGPYQISDGAILYPPTAFLLFIPFIWLPAVLWWAIPIAILVTAMALHRPPLWGWAVIGALIAFDKSLNVFVFGNPSMWIVAAIAAGTILAWPFVLVLVKPTFAPVALLGVRHRSWWIALGVLVVVSLPFLHVWLDWFKVVANSNVSLAYNLPTLPLMCAPLVAWLAGMRRPRLPWPKSGAHRDEVPVQVVG